MTTSGLAPDSAADVVVVGAGPVGLVAACELARRDIAIRLIDKLTVPTDQSRAIAIHARSLEMLDRMGLAEEITISGEKALCMRMYVQGRQLVQVDLSQVDSAFPFTILTPQTQTERILTARLEALGVTIERGTELTGLTQDDNGAHLTVRGPDGSNAQIDTSWVIGADGSHSTVRSLVGTRLEGSFKGERFLLGDVESADELDRTAMHTFFSPAGPLIAFPMRGTRMRFIAQVRAPSGQPINLNPTQEQLQQVVDERTSGIKITKSHWLTEFEIHHAQVPAYRFGRAFLAGDAAHVHSPAGGQGMNTGMQDAFNLAWKLALTVQGRGGSELLDSYTAERHPVGHKVIAFTNHLNQLGTVHGDLMIHLRNAAVHAALGLPALRGAIASKNEEIDISYRANYAHHRTGPGTLAAGDHLPSVPDDSVQQQIRTVTGPTQTGHVILTVEPERLRVEPGADAVPGPVAEIADPTGSAATRFGLKYGGRIVVRPDGYVGEIIGLNDDCASYFAQLAR